MTDDEAFVRNVVDSPGDDLPRLVYADWLQDRDDPRADYLRAELEWAAPWKEGTCPETSPQLWAVAARLDPLWVARVSRPPLGTCCDHTPFEGRGPQLTGNDVRQFEHRHGVTLPVAYHGFLLNVNGGSPDRFRFHTPVGDDANGNGRVDVRHVRVLRASQAKGKPVEVVTLREKYKAPRTFLVVADADSERGNGTDTVLLGLSESAFGQVFDYFFDAENDWGGDELNWLCDSITDFLAGLQPLGPEEEVWSMLDDS